MLDPIWDRRADVIANLYNYTSAVLFLSVPQQTEPTGCVVEWDGTAPPPLELTAMKQPLGAPVDGAICA